MIALERPWLLLLLIPCVLLTLWIGRRTLTGNSTTVRRVALGLRLLVIVLIVGALAAPYWKRTAKDVAVTLVLDASRSVQGNVPQQARAYMGEASRSTAPTDLVGLVSVGREGRVQHLPAPLSDQFNVTRSADDRFAIADAGNVDATNLEGGVRIAMAAMPRDAANRLLIVSDGNETVGSLLAAARSAKAAGIPIDVLPIQYKLDREVIADRLIAPATAREGETVNLRIVLTATAPATGTLNLSMNGVAVDLDPASPGLGTRISLPAGTTAIPVPVKMPGRGAVQYEAVFEPDTPPGQRPVDAIVQNNRAEGVTFVGGEGRVLVLTNRTGEAQQLLNALREAKIQTVVRPPEQGFGSLPELGAFECVLMVNVSASELSLKQQEELAAYVHDLGGGLIMVGGDQAFGAGGWIGSPLAEALPIKMDPPVKRQMPRGALALVMHSCEMPEGNFWGRRTAEAAVDSLSSKDLVGIIEHDWAGGSGVVHPMSVLGDKSAARRALNSLSYGDAPSFDALLSSAMQELSSAQAGQKHVIVISDGDPSGPSDALLQQFIDARITISTVAVFPHSWGNASSDLGKMQRVARVTGGNYHELTQNSQLNSLPQIFIKEAQTIKRTLIEEGSVQPSIVGGVGETLRGISSVPAIGGYVVSAEREGLAQVLLKAGKENDPILAVWQHGLGRVVAYTSDATSRWGAAWTGWSQYRQFWEQHVRWAMRPTGSPNIRVVTSEQGGQTLVVVEALDDAGERLNFLRWQGASVHSSGDAEPLELKQVGPGRYEAKVRTERAGSYTLQMGYEQTTADSRVIRGSVQASVTRPYADEFRALQSNTALLEQVASLTGGRVLPPDDPKAADLWRRDGLTMPVRLSSVWLLATIIAIGVLLMDVAVRRVRLDPRALWRALRRRSAVTSGGAAMGNLKGARARAQGQMAQRAAAAASQAQRDAASALAGAKFEATDAERVAARAGLPTETPSSPAPIQTRTVDPRPTPGAPDAGGMSRLMQAKKRARDEMKE